MDDSQLPQNPYTPSAPPTMPGALPQYHPSTKWPTILGVIGIVLGILAALQAAWGVLSMGFMQGWVPPEMQRQMEQTRNWTIVSSLLILPPAILLLIAGIGLARRRRWGVTFAKIWAVLKIVVAVVSVAVNYHIQSAMIEANLAIAQPGAPNAFASSFTRTFLFVGVAIGLLWLCALPAFMLIWLSREKIKAEVAAWR